MNSNPTTLETALVVVGAYVFWLLLFLGPYFYRLLLEGPQ